MVCKVRVWRDDYSGESPTFEGEGYHNVRELPAGTNPGRPYTIGYNRVTTATGYADESCMIVGYTWHGGGWYHNGKQENGDMFMFPNGGYDLRYAKGQESRTFNDNLDGLQIKTVPSANSSQMQYNINIPVQEPHNFSNPILIEENNGQVKDSNGTLFNPCPGASFKYFNSKPGVRCIYPKTGDAGADALKTLNGAKGNYKSNESDMYTELVGTFCADSENIFRSPGDRTCLDITSGRAIAVEFCKVGKRIKGANGGDANCSADLTSLGDSYGTVAKAFCEANPDDSFCSCYNVVENKCANDKKTGVKGCAETSEYVDLRNATPAEFQSVWNGQRKCGSICTGANKYIPDNNQAGCKTTIQICAQDINVGSMSESDIKASCELNASDGSSAGEPPAPSPAQDSAQSELDEAKAALARGDAGAQERVDAAEAALDAADESAGETGPKAYIPKSLDGLKNDRKQQIGAGVMGALVLGCMMMLLLLVASAGGGGGGPAKRRFR